MTTPREQALSWQPLALDCIHAVPAHFENGEKCEGRKLRASVHTMPEQFENGAKFDGKKSLQDFRCHRNLPAP